MKEAREKLEERGINQTSLIWDFKENKLLDSGKESKTLHRSQAFGTKDGL